MTDAVKKTPKKAATTATKSKASTKSGTKTAASNGHSSNVMEFRVPHEQIAQLAHRYWIERGRQHGHHEEDWYRAEHELHAKAS
jgi:hypothetical protein